MNITLEKVNSNRFDTSLAVAKYFKKTAGATIFGGEGSVSKVTEQQLKQIPCNRWEACNFDCNPKYMVKF